MKKLSALFVGAAILGGFALAPTVNPQAANSPYHKIKGSLSAFNINLKVTAITPAKQKVQTYTTTGKPSKLLPANTRWNVVGDQLFGKNDVRYDLGGGYWVKAVNVSETVSPAKLFKNFQTSTFVASPNGTTILNQIDGFGTRILPYGSQWKYYQKVYYGFNFWYNLGGNQWTTSFNSFE